MKLNIFILSLFIAVLGNASVEAGIGVPKTLDPAPSPLAADLATTTLSEAGYPTGYTFEGLLSNHEKIFHFKVPRSTLTGDAEFILYYRASSDLNARSMVRVDINGEPQITRSLAGDDSQGMLVIPITQAIMQQHDELTVKVKSTLLVTADRCIDTQLSNHYLQLMPQSRLNMNMKQHASNLYEAWNMLPKNVTISIPKTVSEVTYGNALLLARYLIDDGKQVNLVSLPQLGDIIVADATTLNSAISQHLNYESLQEEIVTIRLPENKNAFLLNLPDRQLMVFSEPFVGEPGEILSSSWRKLVLGEHYDVAHAQSNNANAFYAADDGQYPLSLKSLGLDLQTRHITHSTDWYLPLSTPHFGADMVPETLHLELVASLGDTPMIMQVFLNGVLQEVATLANDGKPHHHVIHLSAHDRKSGFNEIRLTALREPNSSDCHIVPTAYPVQITGNSYLVASRQADKPETFTDLSAWFAAGVDIYLPQPGTQQPDQSLIFLAGLASQNNYPVEAKRIHFYKAGELVTPNAPFIILGAAELNIEKVGVHFDKGRINVMSGKGESLLDVDQLPNITISQLVQTNHTHGLWVVAKDGKPAPTLNPLLLGDNSVAFSDDTGLILSITPEQKEINIVDYPEHESWFDLLGKFRFWIWALSWLILTLLVVHLYTMTRQHKNQSKREKI